MLHTFRKTYKKRKSVYSHFSQSHIPFVNKSLFVFYVILLVVGLWCFINVSLSIYLSIFDSSVVEVKFFKKLFYVSKIDYSDSRDIKLKDIAFESQYQ